MRQSLILTLLTFVVCLGCDTAARQQQAEEARRQQTVNELRELGEEMHNNPENQSAPDSTAADTSEEDPDSPNNNAASSE